MLPVILRSVNGKSGYSLAGGHFLFWGGSSAVETGQASPRALLVPLLLLLLFPLLLLLPLLLLPLLPLVPELLLVDRVHVRCVWCVCSPPGRCPLGETLGHKQNPPLFPVPPPGGCASPTREKIRDNCGKCPKNTGYSAPEPRKGVHQDAFGCLGEVVALTLPK